MDIDEHDLQILARILIESSFALAKRYPKASFSWFSLFFSYIFFPSILWFFIYTIPFIVLITAITIKTYINIHKPIDDKIKDDKIKDGNKSPIKVQCEEDSSNAKKKYNAKHARSVRRRRANVTFEDSNHAKQSDLIDKREVVEETPKDIREVEEEVKAVETSPPSNVVSLDFRSRFNSLLRSQRGSTEDAQKNVAELGLSEIERTKRLENLIRKRRARKMLSLHVRRAIGNLGNNESNGQMIYSIEIPKSTNISPRNDQFSPVPGSAPSILLPTRNPFDLPYEPHEEKPNLTGGSFDQEIFATHHKDIIFCRHESFSLGHHNNSSLYNNPIIHKEISERQGITQTQSGDENESAHEQYQQVESDGNTDQNQASEQGPDPNDVSNEEKTKSVIAEDYNERLSFSSSSEENEQLPRLDKEKILKSLSTPPPTTISIQKDSILYDYSLSETETSQMSERLYYPDQVPRHIQSNSLASDMLVEVSEFGSPPQLSEMNISSPDEVRSLSEYRRSTTVNEKMSQQLEMPDNMSTEGNYVLESTPDIEDEVSSIEIATYEPRQAVIHPSEMASVPELMTEQVPTSGGLRSHDFDTNSTDHGQKETSGTSFSYTNMENQETNLDTISDNEEVTGEINPSTSHSSQLEKG